LERVAFSEFGDPLSVLRLENSPDPEIDRSQVLVRMRSRSINPSDLLVVRGLYGALPPLPATPGLEGMGEVARVGGDVHGIRPGQRVITFGIRGTWQEFVAAGREELIVVPEGITDQSAAQFVVNPLSAWIMLVDELAVDSGEWVVQTAAASTLGRIVIQLSRMLGFRTINVVRRSEYVDELKELGADEVIVAGEDLEAGIRRIAGKEKVRKAIDAVGGETGAAVLRALGSGGTMIVYGALSMQPIPVDGSRLIFSSATARGFWFNRWRRTTPEAKRNEVISAMLGAMLAGHVVPPVEAEYPLAEFAAAIRHARQPARRGKVLLTSLPG
jgi:NADPH:quinone reductase-like Zn-dependent oxidoreductase